MNSISVGALDTLKAAVGPVENWLTELLEAKVLELKIGSPVFLAVKALAQLLEPAPLDPREKPHTKEIIRRIRR